MTISRGAMSAARPRAQKGAMVLAQRIMGDVLRRNLRPGDPLPTEREMIESYGAGRATVREALRLLEYEDVITIKPGIGGGPILRLPDSTHLAGSLVLIMGLNQAPLRDVIEVRSTIEPITSALAAERMSEEDLAALRENVAQMRASIDNQHVFLERNREFHEQVAHAGGNVAFAYLVDSISHIIDGTMLGLQYSDLRRTAMLSAHERILAALEARDPERARESMLAHVSEYAKYAERKFPDVMNGGLAWERWIS